MSCSGALIFLLRLFAIRFDAVRARGGPKWIPFGRLPLPIAGEGFPGKSAREYLTDPLAADPDTSTDCRECVAFVAHPPDLLVPVRAGAISN